MRPRSNFASFSCAMRAAIAAGSSVLVAASTGAGAGSLADVAALGGVFASSGWAAVVEQPAIVAKNAAKTSSTDGRARRGRRAEANLRVSEIKIYTTGAMQVARRI